MGHPCPYKDTPHTQGLKTAHWAPALNSSTTSHLVTGEKKVFGGQSRCEGESALLRSQTFAGMGYGLSEQVTLHDSHWCPPWGTAHNGGSF